MASRSSKNKVLYLILVGDLVNNLIKQTKKKVSDKIAPFLRSVTCKLDDVSKTRF